MSLATPAGARERLLIQPLDLHVRKAPESNCQEASKITDHHVHNLTKDTNKLFHRLHALDPVIPGGDSHNVLFSGDSHTQVWGVIKATRSVLHDTDKTCPRTGGEPCQVAQESNRGSPDGRDKCHETNLACERCRATRCNSTHELQPGWQLLERARYLW
jgi:hypothetical protein